MTCFVRNCKNIRRLLGPNAGITFHRFPEEPILFNKWLEVIGRSSENKSWSRNMYICSAHFLPDDFIRTVGLTRLKKSAIPLPEVFASPSKERLSPPEHEMTLSPAKSRSSGSTTTSLKKKRVQLDHSYFEHEMELSPTKSRSSGSTTTSLRRKRVKLDHSYFGSPTRHNIIKQKYIKKFVQQSKKLYRERQKVKKLKRKVTSLTEVLKDLKLKSNMSSDALDYLQRTFEDLPAGLMTRMLKTSRTGTITREKYPSVLRNFALTLNFYSTKAYNYVRNKFNFALPHPSVLRKWSASVECEPGFLNICFDVLKTKVDEADANGRKLVCCLLLDEMDIKKQIDFDGKRNWGYVDLGADLGNYDTPHAQQVLVIMVVALNASWKIPLAYFLIKSLTGAEKANIIKETLIRLDNIGVNISSVTCDGPTANFKMFKDLGCNFKDAGNLTTSFPHPANTLKKVYAIFDACHMLKLMRNCLGDLKILKDYNDEEINWQYIKNLYDVQENETLSLANKLKKSHLEWYRQKMKVNLAAQTFSNSVAEALSYLAHEMKHPDFIGCEATIFFIKKINKLFDILNSRYPWAPNYKAPLSEKNIEVRRPFLIDTINYLLNLKDVTGLFLWKTPRKTPIIGFITTCISALGIFDEYVEAKYLNYLLTYKLSQDHLELFFCSVRSRNGWNNNPSSLQFMHTMRKLLLHCDVSSPNANCRVLDSTSVLSVSSGIKNNENVEDTDLLSFRRADANLGETIDENEFNPPEFIQLTEYAQNVVTYIGGYVVKMLQRTVHCEDCLKAIISNSEATSNKRSYMFLRKRNLGGLIIPSKCTQEICLKTEMYIRQLMYISNNNLPSPNLLKNIVSHIANNLFGRITILIPGHEEHGLALLKEVAHAYCKIRLHNLARKFTSDAQGTKIRHMYNKLILFNHQ